MNTSERLEFGNLIAGVYAYHRVAVSPAIIEVFWNGCQRWSMEQVRHAVNVLTADPEAGKFPPKIGDITRVLEGTSGERAALAWGKVLDTMRRVGQYTDVVFDDPAIHAVIDDLGGWPKVCRTELKELGYLQHRFCESHRAYVGRQTFDYPRRLMGDRSPDSEYEKFGRKLPRPALVGDPERCTAVYQGGSAAGKTSITYAPLALLASQRLEQSTSESA